MNIEGKEKEGASEHSSADLERWDVMTEDGLHPIQADQWKSSSAGLQFFRGGECVAWFASWEWFKKFDLISDPNGFAQIGLSAKATNVLVNQLDCKTIGELLTLSDGAILDARMAGVKVLEEIREKLAAAGFRRA